MPTHPSKARNARTLPHESFLYSLQILTLNSSFNLNPASIQIVLSYFCGRYNWEQLNNRKRILFIRWILSICLAYPLPPFRLQACRWYPIPINFNDERGQFNTSWTHCSKVVGNKSYALVTEKCMTQISAGVICYTPGCLSTRLPSLRYIRAHTHTCTLLQLGNAISFWCAIRIQPPVIWSMGTQFLFFFFIYLIFASYPILISLDEASFFRDQLQATRPMFDQDCIFFLY